MDFNERQQRHKMRENESTALEARTENAGQQDFTARLVRRGDDDYPGRLTDFSDMPSELHVLGQMPGDEPSVAIIGARKCSLYGRKQAELFAKVLARHGVSVISGMASGIDGCAQRAALKAGGKSFAVLGSGVDVCYPLENKDLYLDLAKRGGIISEFEMGSQPVAWHFPVRNRIISALADVVLVIEARRRSGSFITVDRALEQGKSVFALPGRVDDVLSDGCNRLIAQGAGIAYSPQAILDELEELKSRRPALRRQIRSPRTGGVLTASAEKDRQIREKLQLPSGLSPQAGLIFHHLGEEMTSLDQLAAKTGLSVSQTACALTELMLAGEAREPFRHMYTR